MALDIRKASAVLLFASLSIGLGAACSSGGEETPSTSTTTSTTTSETSTPTEKSLSPTGGNLFTPEITAPGPPTPAPGNLPGNHPK